MPSLPRPTRRQMVVLAALSAFGVPLLAATAIVLPETLPPPARHRGGLAPVLRTFGLRDRSFAPYAASLSLSFAAMFGYIAGSSYVLENVYRLSPQLFSVVFAVNSGALIALSVLSGRLVGLGGSHDPLPMGIVIAVAGAAALLIDLVWARPGAVRAATSTG